MLLLRGVWWWYDIPMTSVGGHNNNIMSGNNNHRCLRDGRSNNGVSHFRLALILILLIGNIDGRHGVSLSDQ